MCKKGKHKNCEQWGAEMVMRASKGDRDALGSVVVRYQRYGRKCLLMIARTKYNLDTNTLPVDDLMQIVSMRLVEVIIKKYEISK